MKLLSDYEGEKGMQKTAEVLSVISKIVHNEEKTVNTEDKTCFEVFAEYMKKFPKEMMELFAVLSDEDPKTYKCNGEQALTNLITLVNDNMIIMLFLSPSQKGDANSSGSHLENTKG